jgi:sec-independent protein translocase protein TatA
MFGSLGWEELLIVLVIVALLFGASRVADLGGALGRGIREFRSEASKTDAKKDAAISDEQRSSLDALTKLKADGILTDAEFEAKKADLLAKS